MGNWFFIALIAPFLWAIVNHADKYLLSKYFKADGVGPLMIFSTFFGVFVMPIAALIDPDLLALPFREIGILVVAGFCSALFVLMYLHALQDDETSVVVPFWQTIPIFGYILGFFVFKETLTAHQLWAGALILIGASILSLDLGSQLKVKWKIAFLMLGSSFVYALYEALFRFVALDYSFWASVFWEHVGLFLFGLVLFICSRKTRDGFMTVIRSNSAPIISLNLGSEFLTIVGNLITNYAVLIAPLALVLLVSSYQPVFVFAIGIALTAFLPRIAEESMKPRELIQKCLAIAVIFLGSYFLN